MKKNIKKVSRKWLWVIGVIILVSFVIILLSGQLTWNQNSGSKNCIGEDESVDILYEPKECCEGLTRSNVCSYDVSIGEKCYEPPTDAIPLGCIYMGCSNCGDGICKDNEDVCSCPQDCVGVKEPDYKTVQDFCDKGYEQYCKHIPEEEKTDLCKLCALDSCDATCKSEGYEYGLCRSGSDDIVDCGADVSIGQTADCKLEDIFGVGWKVCCCGFFK